MYWLSEIVLIGSRISVAISYWIALITIVGYAPLR